MTKQATTKPIDILTIGRCSVDLYGEQVGGRLEDMRSFKKYIGGSPANIAIGCARLGMTTALMSRVGDEHMGRFIREQLGREGVNTSFLKTDPDRLSALVILGIRDMERFPLIFYRENCADMALSEHDVNESQIHQCRTVLATGTHLSHPKTCAAVVKALSLARRAGRYTVLDIDYRPNLWGLAGHDAGEERYISSQAVTEALREHLHLFDLIVGTEEEFCIAGGSDNAFLTLKSVREITSAVLVCKRGAQGAVVYPKDIHGNSLDDGESGRRFNVEVYNVLGAGDGFMAGLIWAHQQQKPWQEALECANACGALAVSRHGCAPAYPSQEELQWFLDNGVTQHALRKDKQLAHIHWATNRRKTITNLKVLAFDHRGAFEDLADECNVDHAQLNKLKMICLRAVEAAKAEHLAKNKTSTDDFGIVCDDGAGRDALYAASDYDLCIARPVEIPGSRPLKLDLGDDYSSALASWPANHIIKVLCRAHCDDDSIMAEQQYQVLAKLYHACRTNELELLIEIILAEDHPSSPHAVAKVLQQIYDRGIKPDWWKLEPMINDDSWTMIEETIKKGDPWCQGIVVLGLAKSEEDLVKSLKVASRYSTVKGFAIGRSIFQKSAKDWLLKKITDDEAINQMKSTFQRLTCAWDQARDATTNTAGS